MGGLGKGDVFVIAVLVAVILAYAWNRFGEVEYVTSAVDKRRYLCLKLHDRKEAADRLARINAELQRLVDHMYAKFGDDEEHGADARRLYSNYDPNAISEGGKEVGYTSYSVNKGEVLCICIRNSDLARSFVPHNTVMYVAIHELGHLMTADVGHTPAFWDNFKFLLREAIATGVYTKVDFEKKPEPYCGIRITSSVV